ncbi:MAG: hypothetical protein R3C59_13110 [Planctomycetaceae bacterium]
MNNHLSVEQRFVPNTFHWGTTMFKTHNHRCSSVVCDTKYLRLACFVLMSVAGVSIATPQSLLAREAQDAAENVTPVIIAENSAASSEVRKSRSDGSEPDTTVRLQTAAGAKGWLGRLPKSRPTHDIARVGTAANSNARNSIAAIPPPAPPAQPTTLSAAQNSTKVVDARSMGNSNVNSSHSISHHSVGHIDPLTHIAIELLEGARVPLIEDAPPVPAGLVPEVAAPEVVPSTDAKADDAEATATPSPDGAASSRETPASDPADAMKSHSATELSPKQTSERLGLSRPLNQVSLSAAQRAEGLTGEKLKEPVDKAAELFSEFGVLYESPRLVGVPSPRRICHPIQYNPLYFEDPNMERCGIGHGCLTEVVSAARFFGRVPLLPYLVGSNCPQSGVASLGDCPSCHAFGHDAYLAPLNVQGVAFQAACTVGVIFLIP